MTPKDLYKKARILIDGDRDERRIDLGDRVRDTVTGFEGIVVSRHIYLHGCNRLGVQPPLDKDGKIPEAMSFDEPQLKLVEAEKVAVGSQETGGPEKFMPPPAPGLEIQGPTPKPPRRVIDELR